MSDRIVHLTAAYDELLQLANERQSRLKEARKMWQFYDDVEDEEAWIKEKEQIMSSPDLGHDLTSIRLLLTKHKVQYFCSLLLATFLEWCGLVVFRHSGSTVVSINVVILHRARLVLE